MTEYRIVWEINIEADNPREAAEEALRIQRDPESCATVFEVREEGTEEDGVHIDLGWGG
ncbi:MAG: hypothetical protein GF334_10345 [Candidatus Altiarchaeales archaeon]|nr:hypothetical protein [Candidatus Altiarchaeales archaeon]